MCREPVLNSILWVHVELLEQNTRLPDGSVLGTVSQVCRRSQELASNKRGQQNVKSFSTRFSFEEELIATLWLVCATHTRAEAGERRGAERRERRAHAEAALGDLDGRRVVEAVALHAVAFEVREHLLLERVDRRVQKHLQPVGEKRRARLRLRLEERVCVHNHTYSYS